MKAIFFPVGGEPIYVEPVVYPREEDDEGPDEPDLTWLYETIGCELVELVRTPLGDLWIDEEGKLRNSSHNASATSYVAPYLFAGDYIAGNAVLIPSELGKKAVKVGVAQ